MNDNPKMTLDIDEFIRRFLLHVLPERFVKIRYFGFLSHRNKRECIPLIREFIDSNAIVPEKSDESVRELMLRLTGNDITLCPRCAKGNMDKIEELPNLTHLSSEIQKSILDSS